MKGSTFLSLSLVAFTISCSETPLTEALNEPISVIDAQFVPGEFPGSPPRETGSPARPNASALITFQSNIVQGTPNVEFNGLLSADAVSFAVALEDEGSGYFVLPAGNPSAGNVGFLEAPFRLNVHSSIEPGLKTLRVAAIDAEGKSGSWTEQQICVGSAVPDNGNACNPEFAPPTVVLSLEWNAAVDLDLQVRTPSGILVSPKNRTTIAPKDRGDVDPNDPNVGRLDRDSNQGCLADSPQRENFVVQGSPERGKYLVYVNLFDPCGEEAVSYKLVQRSRIAGDEHGTYAVKTVDKAAGSLVALQAQPVGSVGTYVTDFTVR